MAPLSKCIKKITEDFTGALPYWKSHFDEWIFTHNDVNGLAPDVLKLLLDLSLNNKPLVATHWGYAELLVEYKALSSSDVATLLGPVPDHKDVVSIRLEDVKPLLDHIAIQPEQLVTDVRSVPAAKLQHNQLSPAVATLLKAGMARSEIVKKYLRGLAGQTLYDRFAASFRARYGNLKAEGRPSDDLFLGLQKFVAGEDFPSPSHQAAALAVLAFFFEACEIFERPPEDGATSS
jgi:ABC-3C protein